MSNKVKVIGVGMVKFVKPGTQEPYEIMAAKAIKGALQDAGIENNEIQQAYASYVYGDSTRSNRPDTNSVSNSRCRWTLVDRGGRERKYK